MERDQHTDQTSTALLCNASGVDTPETNSLCCAAAGIIALSATAEALTPHEKLREAAAPDATLIAHNRPPAQPAEGGKPFFCCESPPEQTVFEPIQIDERAEFEKEFPVPEGLRYFGQRGTYICAPGTNTSDAFAREHYGYRAGFAGWMRRSWKRAILDTQRTGQYHLAKKLLQEEA
ncbi:hypothetical protein PSHI_08290 [Pseudomonas sp. URMO17WK12:I11]|nr:hypothetical protein PSHI_08290 [Pseudomonas sp. URMO17WK12:I11]